MRIAACLIASDKRRGDGLPRKPWMTALSPPLFSAFSKRFTWRTLTPSSAAASACVMTRFFSLRNVTSRSLSA